MTQQEVNKKPKLKLQAGSVKLTTWKNEGSFGPYHSTVVEKVYKDARGEWQVTHSFKEQDLQDLHVLVAQALGVLRVKDQPEARKE